MEDTPEHHQLQQPNQQRFLERPQVKIVRPSNRRKFLVGLLGSATILGLGSPVLVQLAQNLLVAFNTKNFPYDPYGDLIATCYSHDLNFIGLGKTHDSDRDGTLYIWDYQQQRMTVIPGVYSIVGLSAWSPDNKYVLCQTIATDGGSYSLAMWDVQTQQKIRSYSDANYTFSDDSFYIFNKIHWSPDGSQIALLLKGSFAILDSTQLVPLFTFQISANRAIFDWSPDGQKLALLVEEDDAGTWSVQIWNLQTREMDTEAFFHGDKDGEISTLAWSPDGEHIAALAYGQLQIIHVAKTLSSYALDEPNNGGVLAWSPDSRYLAVAVKNETTYVPTNEFCVWNIIERNKARVLNRGSIMSSLPDAIVWSRDGSRITAIVQFSQQANWNWS